MRKHWILMISAVAGLTCCMAFIRKNNTTSQTEAIVQATNSFLTSLNSEQHTQVSFAFTRQKAAIAAKFARTFTPGPGGLPPGTGNKQAPRPAGRVGNFPVSLVSNMAKPYGPTTR